MAPSTKARDPQWVLVHVVEERRKSQRISLRTAAERAQTSEANWRQLVAGGVMQTGTWVSRTPRRDQVLDMAQAVGALDEAADALGATEDEVADTKRRVVILDPAEEEIMGMRHLRPAEKLELMRALHQMRGE